VAGFDPDRWAAISPFLDQALDLSDADRAGWLASLSDRDPALAHELAIVFDRYRALGEERFLETDTIADVRPPGLAGTSVGAYTLVSPIGHGGMGSVWLARRSDGLFDARVAVKLLNAALIGREGDERFRREGQILGRLTHAHIAHLIDAGVSPAGQPYLVLEYVEDGEPIDVYCAKRGLDVNARLDLVLDALDAVAHAHANLVVHRDIKPSNVVVRRDGQVKLLDFGIATLLAADMEPPATRLTREGGAAMTLAFAAPEQLGSGAVTTATDVYALGVLVYLLLTGRHPAGDGVQSAAGLVKAIAEDEPPRASDVAQPPSMRGRLRGDLDTIVAKALKKKPEERYASVSAMADDLRRFLRREPISARPDTLRYRTATFIRRNRTAVAFAALAAAAGLAGGVSTLLEARTARAQRDFALRELSRAEAVNDLNRFVLSDAAPSGKPFTVNDLLARAESTVARGRYGDATRVDLLTSIGHQYAAQEEYAKSRRLLEQAYAFAQSVPDPATRARAACSLAQTLGNTGALQRAEALIAEGLRQVPDAPQFVLDRVFCLERGSEVALNHGKPADAIDHARRARDLLAAAPVRPALAELDSLIILAGAYRAAGRLGEASATFARTLPQLDALGRNDTTRAATVFNNYGATLILLGRPLDAEKALHRAIDISRDSASDDAVAPNLLNNYARALSDLERQAEAAEYAARGRAKAAAAGNDVALGQVLLLQSTIRRKLGDLDGSDAALAEADPLMRRTLPPGHIAFGALQSTQSLLAQARGDTAAALELADRAVATAEAVVAAGRGGNDYLGAFLIRRSDLQLLAGHAAAASADAARGVKLLEAASEPGTLSATLGRAHLALARALGAEGRAADARAEAAVAVRQLESASGRDHPDTQRARDLAGVASASR
jgi:serine/threonine-protein kinase